MNITPQVIPETVQDASQANDALLRAVLAIHPQLGSLFPADELDRRVRGELYKLVLAGEVETRLG